MNAQQLPTLDSGLSTDEVGATIHPRAVPATQTPSVELAERQTQPSVLLSVRKIDHTTLTAVIDRTASQKRIIEDLGRALPQFAVPYRELEPKIIEALRIKANENIPLEDVSIRVFGSKSFPRSLRYWRNKWGIR
jgi:hypothetical protein